ncbi:MAG: hypothetical protein K2K40_07260 [Paramuribaculum sp.]|nr:hypothetical protein [Paramuribaculum sp.]
MKQLITLIIASLLLCVGLAACGGDRDIERQLDRADAMMDSIPAEALIILQEIDRSRLGDADAARHALLLSQAYDKTAVDIADDSLIAIARDYYLTHPGRRDMLARAYYYSGVVAFNAADYPESIYYLSLADTLAAGVADHRLRGMANAMLAWSNSELLDLENEYRHAERALRFLTLAGDSARISRQKLYVAICHLQLNRPAEALAMLDSPGCEQSAVTRASSLVELGRLDEFRAMMELNPALSNSSKLMADYARQLVGIGNLVEADSALARALRNAKNISDTASCMGVKAELLKSRGEWRQYAETLEDGLIEYDDLCNETMRHTYPIGYTEALKSVFDMEKSEIDARIHLRNLISVIVAGLLLICFIIGYVILHLRHRFKEFQYLNMLMIARNECDKNELLIKTLSSDNAALSEKCRVADDTVNQQRIADARNLVDSIRNQIDEIINCHIITSSAKTSDIAELKSKLKTILTYEQMRELEYYVDCNYNGVITKMRNNGFKELHIKIYLFEKLGFGNNTIAILIGSIAGKTVANNRTLIRKQVEKLMEQQ